MTSLGTVSAASVLAVLLGAGGAAVAAGAEPAPTSTLITNERTPDRNPDWLVTSGSLYNRAGAWWTGVPDSVDPDATSSNGTGSAVFRLVSKSRAFENVRVDGAFRINRYVTTARTPAVAWDGVHLFLRYQDESSLYYASVARRDGVVVLKKKCAGGPSNGGTYYTLATGRAPSAAGAQFTASAGATTNADGSVSVWLQRDGGPRVSAVDRGIGCAPITRPGGVGVRGDNVDAEVSLFRMTPLGCRT